ncbi:MAG: hypothetical protein NZ959_05685 [Armatimonadetes bacterium]|nr:hypothetical protein [Armatimonadota bacterium]MDW8122417.1 hypothetical protein [Armatimonadota bacterium]
MNSEKVPLGRVAEELSQITGEVWTYDRVYKLAKRLHLRLVGTETHIRRSTWGLRDDDAAALVRYVREKKGLA